MTSSWVRINLMNEWINKLRTEHKWSPYCRRHFEFIFNEKLWIVNTFHENVIVKADMWWLVQLVVWHRRWQTTISLSSIRDAVLVTIIVRSLACVLGWVGGVASASKLSWDALCGIEGCWTRVPIIGTSAVSGPWVQSIAHFNNDFHLQFGGMYILLSTALYWSDDFKMCHYSDVIMSAMLSQIASVLIVCLTVCSGADQRKHQSSATLAFVKGIHRWLVDSPHKRPVTRKMFPLR